MFRAMCILSLLAAVTVGCCQTAKAQSVERWAFVYVHLLDSAPPHESNISTDEFELLLPRLKAAKYNAVVLSSYQLGGLENYVPGTEVHDQFLRNLKRVRAAADCAGIELIPDIMEIGSSGSILQNDPNLAEAVPVKDCEFVVVKRDGHLEAIVRNVDNLVRGGDFNGADPLSNFQTEVSHTTVTIDDTGRPDSRLILKPDATGEQAHFWMQQGDISVTPWHQYQWSFDLQTDGINPNGYCVEGENCFNFYTVVEGHFENIGWRSLHRVHHEFTSVESWPHHVVTINSLGCSRLRVAVGIENLKGKVQIDNLALRNVGGVNLLRRDELKVVVQSPNGDVLTENADFEKWIDPTVGIGGEYLQDQPQLPIRIEESAGLIEGDILKVSYWHASLPCTSRKANFNRVCCSLSNERVYEILGEVVANLNQHLEPKRWLVNHDEIRAMGYEELAENQTAGELLRGSLKRCLELIQQEAPNSKAVLVSDMYDPFHNALRPCDPQSYFPMLRSDLTDSWLGIPPGTTIWNWSAADSTLTGVAPLKVAQSFEHFRALECPQVVAGFYDRTANFDGRTRQLLQLAKQHGEILGACYYTAKGDFRHIEEFSTIVDEVFASQ